jgi:hypothetical protein
MDQAGHNGLAGNYLGSSCTAQGAAQAVPVAMCCEAA